MPVLKKTKSANAISLSIENYLNSKVGNRIDFANAILKNEKIIQGETIVYYSLGKYKKKASYDILTDISEHVYLFLSEYYKIPSFYIYSGYNTLLVSVAFFSSFQNSFCKINTINHFTLQGFFYAQ